MFTKIPNIKTTIKISSALIVYSFLSSNASANNIGKSTYDKACAACHTAGVAGAPKLGELGQWEKRLETGKEALYKSAIEGKGIMPAKGGQAAIADADIKAAVDYIISNSNSM